MSTSIREILNRARWRDGNLHALELVVVHRGAPGDRRAISGHRVSDVGPSGVQLGAEAEGEEPVFLPYHRFLAVLGPDGAPIWDRGSGELPELAGADRGAPTHASPGLAGGHEVSIDHAVVLRPAVGDEPMVIDGSAGEGGGQILRTSLTLSLLTGKPFVIDRIRAKRSKPGLMRQHLTCVRAAAEISDAVIDGAALGSTRLTFRPGRVRATEACFDIGTAGSVALVVQTLALPLALRGGPSSIVVRGGTHARWAPIQPFLERTWIPLLEQMGAVLSLEMRSAGFYPAGGGEVLLETAPSEGLAPLHIPEPRGPLDVSIEAVVAQLSESIARRELSAAARRLAETGLSAPLRMVSGTLRSPGPGNAIWLTARDETSAVASIFSGIGVRGVSAEDVGRGVADTFLAWRSSGAAVEAYLADQLMVPIAIGGEGSFTTHALTLHATTNRDVIEAFTGERLRFFELDDGRTRVELTS